MDSRLLPLLLLSLAESAAGANILALMVVASHSHHLWNARYLEALVERGHRVTYLGVDRYEDRPQNLTHVLVEGCYEDLYGEIDFAGIADRGPYWNTYMLHRWDDRAAAFQARSEALRRLDRIIRTEKFDLVVHDVGACPYLLGAVDVLGRPPVVGITAFGVPTWALEILGNPVAYASKPYFYSPYSDRMTLLQRANNLLLHAFAFAVRRLSLRTQDALSRRCFGPGVRPLEEILDDVNLIMVNSNHGLDPAFPAVPGLVPVGGLHVREPRPLPQDLRSYLDGAEAGVVYFSLGSNIRSADLGEGKVAVLVEAFARLAPVRVLWKWETESLPRKPDNVRLGKWLPQNDVLGHPNVRAFFTHSGMLSTQEAVYHGKPIVAMPFFLDQHVNAKKCADRGLAELVDFASLSVEGVVAAVTKVLRDPRYAERAANASLVFRDQFGSPLDRAVYWTEHAIRHAGAPHLRHSARSLVWYQNWMLDVAAVALCAAFLLRLAVVRAFGTSPSPSPSPSGGRRSKRKTT